MDMHSREQYLESLREEYRRADKKRKTRLLNEARKRTHLNRKVLIRKLAHPAKVRTGKKRPSRKAIYGVEVLATLVQVWEIFDYPCGQRLVPVLRGELDRLRRAREVHCSEEIAGKLRRISAKTIDRLLVREKRERQLRRNRNPGLQPLLYQKIPVKVAADWDTSQVGNVQVDYVEHCGRSMGGEYLHTLSAVDIASSWWEGEPIAQRTQEATQAGMSAIRRRAPFRIREIHSDNDRRMINDLLWRYCRRTHIRMSRSRPYKKNDNAWVEQRNWTHVRKVVGYRRLDTTAELAALRDLYKYLRLYKNFFQAAMKLKAKVRSGGKIHRQYDEARTPYQRLLDSGQLSQRAEKRLRHEYESLNVAELRRKVEQLRNRLFDLVENKAELAGWKRRGRGRAISLTGFREAQRWRARMAQIKQGDRPENQAGSVAF
jgi:Integrase core domain